MAEIKIYGTLVNATTDPKIAKASQIFDEELNKYQSEINTQLGISDDSLHKELTNFKNTKGKANGLASLDDSGKVPSTQLPSYVDDVLEFTQLDQLPKPGESGKIYVVTSTNLQYRWSGSDYVEISKSLALGETSSTAYPGDKGKATTDVVNSLSDNLVNDVLVSQSDKNSVSLTIKSITKNPVKKNKELLLVDGEPILLTDNTPILLADNVNDGLYDQADDKTITINQASAFAAGVMSSSDKIKLDDLKSQAEIDTTINNVQNNLTTHINDKANPHQVTKEQVGLSNVDNTSDANKPISTATQNALNDKFSATEGNTLKQIVNDMPDLVVTGGSLRHDSDSVSLNLIQQDLKNPDDASSFLLKFNPATTSTAGIILPSDKSKIDKIITNGNGTKYLSDNGTYKEVSGGGESNIYVFSPTISGNGISEQDYNNFKEAANEGKVILVPNTLHDRKISGQFVPINYYGTSTFVLSYIRPLEEADGTLVSDLCMVYIYNTYEIGGTAVRITNAKNLIIPNVNTILRPVSLQGQDAQSKINELFSSAGNFKDVVEDILVNHTRYYFHFDNKLTNCIELGCVNAWRNDARTSYELHFIVVYNTNNTYYTSKVSVIYSTDINNTKYHVTNLIQSDNVSSAYVLDKNRDNRKSVSLVGEGFDENHWYPVSFTANPNSIVPPCNLIIWNSLNVDSQNEFKPSWATNADGFVVYVNMTIVGNGWGQIIAPMILNDYRCEWGGETAVGEMHQTTQTSTFYIYLRGGARYYYISDYGELEMTAHSSEILDGYNTYSIKDTQGYIKDFFTYVETDLFSEVKNLQIVHDNEFNFANNSIGDHVWINYRSRYDAVTSAKAVYVGNGQAGADGAFGAIHASGFFKESDVRLKSNIAPLNHTLDQICEIPTVEFNMHDKHQIGTIAQDLENNFAEVVNTDSDGMKSVDYCMLGVVAIEGIKLLKQEVEDLKKQIEELKNGK